MNLINNRNVIKLIVLLSLLFCYSPFQLIGQNSQNTPYELKVVEIHTKYLAKIYYHKNISQLNDRESYAVSLAVSGTSYSELPTLIYAGLAKLYQSNPSAANQLKSSYEKEIKEAAKLKNKTDYEREKLIADKEAREKRKKEIAKTDYEKVINNVRYFFSEWSKKGEFEKQEDWNARLLQKSEEKFTTLCNQSVSLLANCGGRYNYWLEEYNADGEFFTVDFATNSCHLELKLKIPYSDAKRFKEKINEKDYFFRDCFFVSHAASNFQIVQYKILPKEIVFYNLDFFDLYYHDSNNGYAYDKRGHKYAVFKHKYKENSTSCLDDDSYRNRETLEKLRGSGVPYSEEDSVKLSNPWRRSSQVIPCCVRENINPKYEIEDVVIYFDDLELDNPYMNGSSYNYTKQQFNANPTMAKFKAEAEARQQKIREEEEKQKRIESMFQASKKLLQDAVADYHSQLKKTPYDYEKNALSLSIPEKLKGDAQRLSDTLQFLLDSVKVKKTQLQNQYIADSTDYSRCNASLQNQIAVANAELLAYPYNCKKRTINDSISFSLFGKSEELAKELSTKLNTLSQRQKQMEDEIYQELKTTNPKHFAEIYFVQNPTEKQPADSTYIECRCQYSTRNAFDIAYIDKSVSHCDCREKKYQEVKYLYRTRDEFDLSYDKEQTAFEIEVNDREKMWQKIMALDHSLSQKKQINLKKALTSSKPDIIEILDCVKQHQNSYYYIESLEVIFKYDEKLMKEWNKHGSLFKSKAEMYEIWIGEEYDKVLKARKKE